MQVAVFADGWEFDSGRDASPQERYDKSRPVVRIGGPGRLGRASIVPEAQAIFCRLLRQPRGPPLASKREKN